jgi:uncharacterized protein
MTTRFVGVALATLLLLPAALDAQTSTFVLRLNGDTLGVERVTRTAGHLEGDFLDKLQGARIRYAATLGDSATFTRFEIWISRGTDTTVLTHAVLHEQEDTMIVEHNGGPTQRIPTSPHALVFINPSPTLLEQAVLRARALGGGTVDVPLFAVVGGRTAPLSVTFVGSDSAHLTLGGVAMRASLGLDGRLTGLVVPSQNMRVTRVEGANAPTTAMEKPDYSAPADAPYTAEEVTLKTPSGVTLAGTLTLPKVRPPRGAPAVVTITGSGTEERDESLPGVRGYRPFREIADTLGRRGIAVLRLDDRGIGGSDAGPPGATSADFAQDIEAALNYLRTRRDIDGSRLALVGHSEGGMIAPMVAAADPKLHAIVLMAGPSHTGRAILAYQQQYAADSMLKLTGTARDSALRVMAKTLDSAAANQPWLKFFIDYDPVATAKRVKQPVLILQGATDRQVTPEQANELAQAFRAGGNRDVTVKFFPSTDHLFLPDPNGNPSGYAKLPSKGVRPEVLGTIADWLAAHLR